MIASKTLKSKTFWAGIASVATGIGLIVAGDVLNGINMVGMGVLAVCGRDAVSKLQP